MRPNLRLSRRRSRQEVVHHLRDALPAAFPGAGLAVVDEDGRPVVVEWHEGPSPSAVLDVVGTLQGWERAVLPPGVEPDTGDGAHRLALRRHLGERALAVAVVRFQASQGRPYRSRSARDHAPMLGIVDRGAPDRSGYPVVDAMVDLLLAEPGPAHLPERPLPSPADEMAWRLEAAGYDRLWAVAWKAVE